MYGREKHAVVWQTERSIEHSWTVRANCRDVWPKVRSYVEVVFGELRQEQAGKGLCGLDLDDLRVSVAVG